MGGAGGCGGCSLGLWDEGVLVLVEAGHDGLKALHNSCLPLMPRGY